VVVWHTPAEGNANGGEVFGQLLGSEAAVLDVDSNGSVQALADGLLVLRFLFGFSGSTLTTGAVGPRCARCVATTLADYLTSRDDLDIDGNGDLDALTDGILIVRYLFGLRGVTLTSGAVGAGCVRCDAATIEPYLGDLVAVD
jgi:hypothetical protein